MEKREEKITIRVSQEELAVWKEKAKDFDGNVSKFARHCIDCVIKENTIPKSKLLWFIQMILSDSELRKSRKMIEIVEEVFEWL